MKCLFLFVGFEMAYDLIKIALEYNELNEAVRTTIKKKNENNEDISAIPFEMSFIIFFSFWFRRRKKIKSLLLSLSFLFAAAGQRAQSMVHV